MYILQESITVSFTISEYSKILVSDKTNNHEKLEIREI